MISYHHPPGVEPLMLHGRPVLGLPRNGRVAIDDDVLALWKMSDGQTLEELIAKWPAASGRAAFVTAALACLAEARLLLRKGESDTADSLVSPPAVPADAPLVSGIIISYDSLEWLDGSIGTLLNQRYPAVEAIVVDNGSPQDPTSWIAERYPSVRVLRLPPGRSFAHAVNQGVAMSGGRYAFVLNPDIELHAHATAHMVRVAGQSPDCAAVAAKLLFWWAPAFLNGLGNRVDAASWGTDNFIGHLDLGQFDAMSEVPSVCFAAALIRRSVWDEVGGADEGFPMYYEDVEWSYRARLLGYRILAAPDASVEHVFGGRVRSGEESDLTPFKVRNAAYGRLRFALKLLGSARRRLFLRNYLAEDATNLRTVLARGEGASARAYAGAWGLAARDLRTIAGARRRLQASRRVSDEQLFAPQQDLPEGLMWHGIPDLSGEVIMRQYLPLLAGGHTRRVPEFLSRPVSAS
jgi:GT2 family glycosyltransferase